MFVCKRGFALYFFCPALNLLQFMYVCFMKGYNDPEYGMKWVVARLNWTSGFLVVKCV